MIERLESIYQRFLELTELISNPEIIANMDEWKQLVKEHSSLEATVEEYLNYKRLEKEMAECQIMMKEDDKDLATMAEEEYYQCLKNSRESFEKLKVLLLPVDPNDDKNVIIEIRAGAGGDEAGLFGTELTRMYMAYADIMKWKIEEIDMNYNDLGGVKEVVFMISGNGAYSKLKFESGVHRVQRVPATESQGRVHTSTVTVAVLPEVEDVEIDINEKDLKVDTYRSSGAGGQHVNKTESAIRITHIPTGLVVECQDERSQIKNRDKAMKVLKSRLYDLKQSEANKLYADNRKAQVGTGDRSERIRTYNYPQGRVTDHRINLTLYSLPQFMAGNINEMIDALAIALQNAQLANQENI